MEESFDNSDLGCDNGSTMETPFFTPNQKPILPKSGLEPINLDLSLSSGGDSSAAFVNEGSGSSFSSSSYSEVQSSSLSVNTDDKVLPEGVKLKEDYSDLDQEIHSEENRDNILPEREKRSYDELLRKFMKNEKELKVSNDQLQLSEKEIVKLKILIELSEGQCDNVRKELRMKMHDLEYEKGQVLELQNKTDDLEALVTDCCHKIARLEVQLEEAQNQLEASNDEKTKLKEELSRRYFSNHELVTQLSGVKQKLAILEWLRNSGKKATRELEDKIEQYQAVEANHVLEVQKLKAEKDKLHSDNVTLTEKQKLMDSKLKEWESRNDVSERNAKQSEAEKLKQKELHDTQQKFLKGEICRLKEGLDQSKHNLDAVNKEFDRHKQKYDMLMTEKDEANAMFDNVMAELSSRNNQIVNMERELAQLRAQQAELISESETRLNLVNELELKVEELENVVTEQNAVISDRAEEKREAIRQLCFSIEHYKSRYQELLDTFPRRKPGDAVRAS
ncbi:hypothetical protein RIF29_11229 [Crotalaria pallida]|uniref:Uncharacterized protein n=1 Tax=Crotalaria pallida TaxID=3830 RepID=A0AAN9ILY1_CROPI